MTITDREVGQLIEKVNTLITTTTETKSDVKDLKEESKDHGERLAAIEAKLAISNSGSSSNKNKTEVNVGNTNKTSQIGDKATATIAGSISGVIAAIITGIITYFGMNAGQ